MRLKMDDAACGCECFYARSRARRVAARSRVRPQAGREKFISRAAADSLDLIERFCDETTTGWPSITPAGSIAVYGARRSA